MKLRLLIGVFVLGAASSLLTSHALSQDPGQVPSPEEMQKAMEDYMASMKPGPQHRMLDSSIGEWNTSTKMWWGGPGSEPNVTEGTATRRWVLDGRFVQESTRSVMMMPDPATGAMTEIPWEGMGLLGYDNNRNMFNGVWADSLGTYMLTMKGSADPTGTVFSYYGEMDEPMLGVVGRYVKYETTIIDKDKHVFAIYDLHAADDYKVVEITYTRKGK